VDPPNAPEERPEIVPVHERDPEPHQRGQDREFEAAEEELRGEQSGHEGGKVKGEAEGRNEGTRERTRERGKAGKRRKAEWGSKPGESS
jgi:hypothetical protein